MRRELGMRSILAGLIVAAVLFAFPALGAEGKASSTLSPREHYQLAYRMIELGGTQAEMVEAVNHLKIAAVARFIPAYTLLGTMMSQGTIVQRDPEAAKVLLQTAAEAGDSTAMNNLAVLMAEGRGVPRDLASARRWAVVAADKGVGSARDLLRVIDERLAATKPKHGIKSKQKPTSPQVASRRVPPPPPPAVPVKNKKRTANIVTRAVDASSSSEPGVRGGTVSGESADTPIVNRFYVQVAAVGGDRDPETEWGRLIRRHRADLIEENPIYEVIARKRDQRSFIRILLGPLPDRNAAKRKCANLLELGMKGCLLRRE